MIQETFTRLEDGSVLDISELTNLTSIPGVYDTKKTREFSYGEFGRAIELSTSIDQKIFTMIFTSGDSSGQDLKKINRFFSLSDGLFKIEAQETYGISQLDFYAYSTEIDIEKNSVVVTCMAEYGDFVEELISTIYTYTIPAGGSFLSINRSYTNNTGVPVSIRFTIEAPSIVGWYPDIPITLRKGENDTDPQVSTRSGINDERGNLVGYNSLSYAIDSWDEITEGSGVINPGSTSFWKVKPGEAVNIYIGAFAKPIVQNIELQTKLEAIVLQQKETL